MSSTGPLMAGCQSRDHQSPAELPAFSTFHGRFWSRSDAAPVAGDNDGLDAPPRERARKKRYGIAISVLALLLIYLAIDRSFLYPMRDLAGDSKCTGKARTEASFGSDGKRSIAVLPFQDMSPEQDQAYFVGGITEEVLYVLASIKDLRVTSGTSSFALRNRTSRCPKLLRPQA